MKPEKMRQKIAEALGWKGPDHPDTLESIKGWWSSNRGVWWITPNGEMVMLSSVPNYPESLDACAEFESALKPASRHFYMCELERILGFYSGPGGWDMGPESLWAMVTATPLQRCEAFLKTKGLWEEDK